MGIEVTVPVDPQRRRTLDAILGDDLITVEPEPLTDECITESAGTKRLEATASFGRYDTSGIHDLVPDYSESDVRALWSIRKRSDSSRRDQSPSTDPPSSDTAVVPSANLLRAVKSLSVENRASQTPNDLPSQAPGEAYCPVAERRRTQAHAITDTATRGVTLSNPADQPREQYAAADTLASFRSDILPQWLDLLPDPPAFQSDDSIKFSLVQRTMLTAVQTQLAAHGINAKPSEIAHALLEALAARQDLCMGLVAAYLVEFSR